MLKKNQSLCLLFVSSLVSMCCCDSIRIYQPVFRHSSFIDQSAVNVSIPLIPLGSYYNSTTKELLLCDAGICPNGTVLSHCGGKDNPGYCTPCTNDLPVNAMYYLLQIGSKNGNNNNTISCPVQCEGGHFFNISSNECMACNSLQHRINIHDNSINKCLSTGNETAWNYFTAGCDNENPGDCYPCPDLVEGTYWSSTPLPSEPCEALNCTDCSSLYGYHLQGCGLFSPGTCEPCIGKAPSSLGDYHIVNYTAPGQCLDVICHDGYRPVVNAGGIAMCEECTEASMSVCPSPGMYHETMCSHDCIECPSYILPDNSHYYHLHQHSVNATSPLVGVNACNVSYSSCNDVVCPVGYELIGCGGKSKGHCSPCGDLSEFDPNANAYIPSLNGYNNNNYCQLSFKCKEGFHFKTIYAKQNINPFGKCIPCNEIETRKCDLNNNEILINCNSDQEGQCVLVIRNTTTTNNHNTTTATTTIANTTSH